MLPAIPDRADSLPQVITICEHVEAWLLTTDDVGAIGDSAARLGAIGEYRRLSEAVKLL